MANKVAKGDRFSPRAADWNRFIDTADRVLSNRGPVPAGPSFEPLNLTNTLLQIRNDSGDDRAQFEILGLDDPVFSFSDNEECFKLGPCFKGITPTTAAHSQKFVILQEPIRDGEIGLGLLYGLTAVQISASISAEQFAEVKNNDPAKLLCRAAGSARIIWKESGTGTKWAYVFLSPLTNPLVIGFTSGGITARSGATPGSGTVTIYEKGASDVASIGRTETVYSLAQYAVGVNTYVECEADSFGNLWLVWSDC